MTLFDGLPLEQVSRPAVVLSASRMTDMPKYYPRELIAEIEKRLAKGLHLHSVVLWTKHPQSLFTQPLYDTLLQLQKQRIQLFAQITITGFGGRPVGLKANGKPLNLEPQAPPFEQALAFLPKVVELVGKPERLKLRIDPLVTGLDSRKQRFSNLPLLPVIVEQAAGYGIRSFCFSFAETGYTKVSRRFRQLGCTLLSPSAAERTAIEHQLKALEQKLSITLAACCVAGFADSRCIDGRLLLQLHDDKLPVDCTEPRRRPQCGCTTSIDIGGWPPKPCLTGCDYCYARPVYVD